MTSCGRSSRRGDGGRRRAAGRSPGPAITVRASPLDPRRGILRLGPLALPCTLGRSGRTVRKREGDGATPIGRLAILGGAMRRDRWRMPPASPLRLDAIGMRDGWCDAPRDPSYNRPVRLPHPASAERMRREDRLYDAVIVLDWNVTSRARGRGSAIFLHVAKPGMPPTEGCIALPPAAMRLVLPHLRRGRLVTIP